MNLNPFPSMSSLRLARQFAREAILPRPMIRTVFPSCSPFARFHRTLFFLLSYLTLQGPPGVYPDRVGEAGRSSLWAR